jgi:hypothetical protein
VDRSTTPTPGPRRVALLIAIALLAIGVVALWPTPEPPRLALVADDDAARPDEVGEVYETKEESSSPTRTPLVSELAAPEAPSLASRRVEIHVIVTDEHGLEHGEANGTATVSTNGRGSRLATHRVAAGRFSIDSPVDATRIRIHRLRLADRPTEVVDTGVLLLPNDGELVVRALWIAPLVLRVRDAITGRDLQNVEIAEAESDWIPDRIHDDHRRTKFKGLNSPVPLDELQRDEQGPRALYAHAPGYAWKSVNVDPKFGGAHQVFLERGGDLEVDLRPSRSVYGSIRIRVPAPPTMPQSMGELIASAPVSWRGANRFEGLPPGRYTVRLERGDMARPHTILAAGEVVVDASETARIELEVGEDIGVRKPFAGTVRVPLEWTERSFSILVGRADQSPNGRIIASSAMTTDPDDPTCFRFDVEGGEFAGTHLFSIPAYGFATLHTVPPAGDTAISIVVPPPATATVQIVDAATGEPAPLEQLRWSLPAFQPWSTDANHAARVTPGDAFEFVAAAGTVLLLPPDLPWIATSPLDSIDLAPGPNEFRIEVVRAPSVRFELRSRSRPLPHAPSHRYGLRSRSGEGEVVGQRVDGIAMLVAVSAPGAYLVEFPEYEGFEPVAPIELELAAGETLRRVVELRLRP